MTVRWAVVGSNRTYAAASVRSSAPSGRPASTTGWSNSAYTNIRVAPLESRLRTSENPVTTPVSGSTVKDALALTLSKSSVELGPVKVKRKIAAWSVGAISVLMPFSKVTA